MNYIHLMAKNAGKKILIFTLCLGIILSVAPVTFLAADPGVLEVEHLKQGDLANEISKALTDGNITESSVNTLVIKGRAGFNTSDWATLGSHTHLSVLQKVDLSQFTGTDLIAAEAFRNAIWLQGIILSDKIKVIEERAFQGCSALKAVSLPGVDVIGSKAFSGCTSLTRVEAPYAATLEASAFDGCQNLQDVGFPEATSVGDGAFAGCTTLRNVALPKAKTIGSDAFDNCKSLAQVLLGDGASTTINATAFQNATPEDVMVFYSGTVPAGIPAKYKPAAYTGKITLPTAKKVVEGESESMSIAMTPGLSGVTVKSYQWYKNGAPLGGEDSATYTVKNAKATDEGNYQARIRFSDNTSFTSPPAYLTVTASPDAIQNLPQSHSMRVGEKVTWEPKPADGTWSYDKDIFDAEITKDKAVFTAKKEGNSTVTYSTAKDTKQIKVTVGAASSSGTSSSSGASGSGAISTKPSIPNTGTGSIVILITVIAVFAVSVALVVALRRKKPLEEDSVE